MKKLFSILFILIFLGSVVPVSLAAEKQESNRKWVQLADNIYMNKRSLTTRKGATYAWFKIFPSENTELPNAAGFPVSYSIIKIEALCKYNVITRKYIKSFDENGRILQDEPDNRDFYVFPEFTNGKIYFNALCSR
ncbi:MAG: hypothetical protein LUG16_05085 [Candidatus Gastranaerophilales bacterium]|nr:hypothetical protein [Candidatus Gastranaerophilales bacterium]